VRIERSERVNYVDWFPLLWSGASANLGTGTVFYLGSNLVWPTKDWKSFSRGTRIKMNVAHGYFDPMSEETTMLLKKMRAFLRTWYGRHVCPSRSIGSPITRIGLVSSHVSCGAAIDYVAEKFPRHRGTGARSGMALSPGGGTGPLWKRYLVEPWLLLFLIGRRGFDSSHRPKSQRPGHDENFGELKDDGCCLAAESRCDSDAERPTLWFARSKRTESDYIPTSKWWSGGWPGCRHRGGR